MLRYKTIFLIIIMFGSLPFSMKANDTPNEKYQKTPVFKKEINKNDWQKAIEGIDYTGNIIPARKKKPKENNQNKEQSNLLMQNLRSNTAKVILVAIVGILFFLLFRFALGKYILPVAANKNSASIIKATEISQLEENLNLYDPSLLIDKAIVARDYRLAVRLYYLKTLRQLSLKNIIKWEKRKTNYDYLQELSSSDLKDDFEQLTQVYERAWYGNKELGTYEFQQIQPQFDYLVSKINLTILNS